MILFQAVKNEIKVILFVKNFTVKAVVKHKLYVTE